MVKIVNSNEFNEEIKSGVVVVDFFATWCGPCKMLAPIFEDLSTEMNGKVKFIKVDVDQCPDVAMKYNVASIPTIVVFKDGKNVNTIVGFVPKEKIKETVEAYL
ncbi:MAG TPA: thioredoxin [Clostridium sp.]|jgi:thioredoxin 1|uniref:thioredoxin n=1 Tax=unclassified Clostridium TaxID=2614128 RepID=UPI000EE05763|nr:thioredoxin [Clostridium sp.]